MKALLVVLFWCWFAVSFAILVRRAARKASGRSTSRAGNAGSSTTAANVATPSFALPASLATVTPAGDTADAARLPDAPRQPEAAGRPAIDGAPVAKSIFVRANTQQVPVASRRDISTTIADALKGIRMPCDLTPLTGSDADFERRAAFVTVGFPAEAVAPEVADEIERLGMAFNALSDTTAVAQRDDVRVKIAIRAVGASVKGVADPLYPTAPEHSVIVEFELA